MTESSRVELYARAEMRVEQARKELEDSGKLKEAQIAALQHEKDELIESRSAAWSKRDDWKHRAETLGREKGMAVAQVAVLMQALQRATGHREVHGTFQFEDGGSVFPCPKSEYEGYPCRCGFDALLTDSGHAEAKALLERLAAGEKLMHGYSAVHKSSCNMLPYQGASDEYGSCTCGLAEALAEWERLRL